MANLTKMANFRQRFSNVPMTWQRVHFESGDFGKKGIFGKNREYFER